jgi:hypothetical protein
MRLNTLNSDANNPFAMMLDPQRVALAVEHSERLNRLHSRVYRPLDKPMIPKAGAAAAAEFDRLIDDTVEPELMDDAETL